MWRRSDKPEERTPADVERAEARAAERARREARRQERASRPAKPKPVKQPAEETRGEVIQRRVSAVVILLVIAVVIMALADAAPFFDDTTEEERVGETVERFFAAYGDGDYATMCSLFSPDVAQAIEQAGATETKQGEPGTCAEVLDARYGAPSEDERIKVRVEDVRVSGPRAIAMVVLQTPDSPRGKTDALELELGPDGWLLTSPVITG